MDGVNLRRIHGDLTLLDDKAEIVNGVRQEGTLFGLEEEFIV
jgi:hypothetical protein